MEIKPNNNGVDKELKELFELVERAFANHDLLFVNNLLINFDPYNNRPIIAVGLLRTTFRFRSQLTEWKPCVDRVSEYFTQRGDNAKHILRGLL